MFFQNNLPNFKLEKQNENIENKLKELETTVENVGKSNHLESSLLASGWAGTGPYTLILTAEGVTPTNNINITPDENITKAQLDAYSLARIIGIGQSTNQIILKAFGSKPTIDIPINIDING